MGQWNAEILDRYLAPGISQFTKANIPDLAPMHTEAQHWHANHFLNNVFRASFASPSRQYVFNILYRSQVCFDRYQQARAETQDFLGAGEPRNPAIRKYFHALSTWETVFLNWQMAVDIWRKFVEDDPFTEGDGSREDRAYSIANGIKHCASAIRRLEHSDAYTVPVWLTNDGLQSRTSSVSFEELAHLLTELIRVTDEFRDAQAFVDKVRLARTDTVDSDGDR